MSMNGLIADSLWIYGLAAAVSLLIAAIIKLIVVLLGHADGRATRVAQAAREGQRLAAPAAPAAADADTAADAQRVAAISAALAACIGEHRIVRIEDAARGAGWAAAGRLAHHSGHRPADRRTPR